MLYPKISTDHASELWVRCSEVQHSAMLIALEAATSFRAQWLGTTWHRPYGLIIDPLSSSITGPKKVQTF